MDHIEIQSRLCLTGQRLRILALGAATRIDSVAWRRATAEEQQSMLDAARLASGQEYEHAFCEWRKHYRECAQCRGALWNR